MSGLLGRAREMALLSSAFDAAVAQRSTQVVMLSGEAGIGKSRLLADFAAEIERSRSSTGALVGYGQSVATTLASESFAGFRECLRSLSANAASREPAVGSRLAQSLARTAPDWLTAVPLVGDLLAASARTVMEYRSQASPGATPELSSALDQLVSFVNELAAQQPLVLILDDLHWADISTLDVLTTIALRVERPLLLVLAYRADDLKSGGSADDGTAHPLLRAVLRVKRYLEGSCTEVVLGPLSEDDLSALVATTAPGPAISQAQLHAIVERSGGNPLFAQSLALLPERGAERSGGRAQQMRIKAVLDERLSYLSTRQVGTLETASVIGFLFEVDYLAELTRTGIDELYDALDDVIDLGGFIEPALPRDGHERYVFHHPLLFELLRERSHANGPRWRRSNQRFLQLLQEEADAQGAWGDEAVVRAVSVAVESTSIEQAHSLGLIAARRQFELGAVRKAVELGCVALDYARDAQERFAASLVLARCQTAAGDHRACARVCEEVEIPSGAPRADVLERLIAHARSLRMLNRWADLAEAVTGILGDLGDDEQVARAQVLMLRAEAELCGPEQDVHACRVTLGEVLDVAADPALRARAFGHRGLAALAAGDPVASLEDLTGCLAEAERSGHPYVVYEALHWQSKQAIAVLDLDRARALLGRTSDLSEASGVAGDNPFHSRDLSRVEGLSGRVQGAADHLIGYVAGVPEAALPYAYATLVLQTTELSATCGQAASESFLRALEDRLVDEESSPRLGRLRGIVATLTGLGTGSDPVTVAIDSIGLAADDVRAADGIFRFDVPDLAALRASLVTT